MNMTIWDAVKKPPATALKTIGGGRLKSLTNISPQWRLQVMTEQFGPCGDGWKYQIDRLWEVAGTEGQVAVFVMISLFVKIDGQWSAPIPGVGGSMFVAKEKEGLKTSDEAYKMALTDALSVAMKQLGVGAEVYLGQWDGLKYKDVPKEAAQIEQNPEMEATLRSASTMKELMDFWKDMTPDERSQCARVKDEMKASFQ